MRLNNLKSILLAGTASGALLALSPAAQAQSYTTGPGFFLSFEGRYVMNAGDKAKNYFLAGDPAASASFTPYKTSKTDADKGWGGKAMLGYRFFNNWDVAVAASFGALKGKDKSHSYNYGMAPAPLEALAPNAVVDNLKVKLQYVTADFEAGYNMPVGGNSNFRLFGGIRFAHLDQRAKGSVDHALFSGVYFDYSGRRKTSFTGVGPRVGANGAVGIGNSGFNLFGGISGALLIGRYHDRHAFSYIGTNAATNASSFKDNKKTKLVPNAEGEIGLGYNFNAGGGSTVGLQLGYRGEAFFGAATKGADIGVGSQKASGDYLLHGPFARLVASFGAAKPMPAAAPPPQPPVNPAINSFTVFFDFDRSTITAQAQKTIEDAAAQAKARGSARITLTGHADRSGSEQYNIALSMRRGEAVKASLIRLGIPASAIAVIARGESQPLVPTADGVREPQNRRVEIVI